MRVVHDDVERKVGIDALEPTRRARDLLDRLEHRLVGEAERTDRSERGDEIERVVMAQERALNPARGITLAELHSSSPEGGIDVADRKVGGVRLPVSDRPRRQLRGETFTVGVVDTDDGGPPRAQVTGEQLSVC